MSFPKYPAYKDSGVEWLGEVPEHWEMQRLKFIASINDDVLPEDTDSDFEFQYVDISSVNAEQGIIHCDSQRFGGSPSRARRIVKAGDTIVSTVRTYLRAIAPIISASHQLIVSTGFAVVRPREVKARYLSFTLREASFVETIVARSVGVSYPAINASEIGNIACPLPTDEEQTKIAQFLDYETSKIDVLIAEQQRLIDLLKEKRQAVISHAVTKGLDPSVPMKDSGVEWLGEVPAHWMMKKLKNVMSAVGGSTPSKEREDYWNGDVPWVSPKDMKSERIHDSIDRVTLMALNDTSLNLISEGAVLIVVRGMILLHSVPVAINDVSVTINQDMKAMRPIHVLSNDYLFLLLQGFKDALFQYIDTAAHGTRKLEWERFELLDLPLPPIHEQVEIVRNISSLKEKLEALMQSSHSMMVLLLERRSSLISAAVTGKIDVRGWRPPASSASSSQDNLNMETA